MRFSPREFSTLSQQACHGILARRVDAASVSHPHAYVLVRRDCWPSHQVDCRGIKLLPRSQSLQHAQACLAHCHVTMRCAAAKRYAVVKQVFARKAFSIRQKKNSEEQMSVRSETVGAAHPRCP